ncbi:helix-turn-helix transcriptional regulator [Pyramidobacter porci]|uniref:helix-turn-helix transcriptional regulator n=1 Tax=Pyramidobacter porci TaxID=2605789 RepID=UPI00389AAAC4
MEKLRCYRQFRGLSRAELAHRVGISTETLARYERGDREPNTTITKRLALVLKCTPNELLGVDGKRPGA